MSVYAKIRGMVLDGLLKLADTTKKAISVQVEVDDDYVDDGIPLLQTQGVRFRPPADAEVVMLCINGDPARPVAIMAVHRDTCPTDDIEEGEGGLYYGGGWLAFVAEDGTVSLGAKAATAKAAVDTLVEAELDKIRSAIAGAAATPNDGGAAFKAAILAAWGTRGSVGSDKVKVEP